MKYILLLSMLMLFFTGSLFANEMQAKNIGIETLSEAPDFDVINHDIDSQGLESVYSFKNLEINKIHESIANQPEDFNVLFYPNLRPEAMVSHNVKLAPIPYADRHFRLRHYLS